MEPQKKQPHTEGRRPVLTFFLGSERYAVPLSDVREVNRLTRIKKVPNGPACLIGLINLHGKTVPVLNLKSLLRLESVDLAPKAMWFAVGTESSPACLAVDRLSGFMEFAAGDFDPFPETAGDVHGCGIRGYAREGDSLMPVLDIATLLSRLPLEIPGDADAGVHFPEVTEPEIGRGKGPG